MPIDQSPSLSILVIDDERVLLSIATSALEGKFSVTTAATSQRALALLREREFDVVLSDINMEGFTGFELYAWLAANRPGAEKRMILMSGEAVAAHASAFAAVTGAHWLQKPFGMEELRGAVDRVLGAAAA